MPNSRHLRVTVSNSMVTFDYVRAYLPEDENPNEGRIDGKVDYTYTIHSINTSTKSQFQIFKPSHVIIEVYNIQGREWRTLVDNEFESGFHTIVWNSSDYLVVNVSSGIYLYRLQIGEHIETREFALMR